MCGFYFDLTYIRSSETYQKNEENPKIFKSRENLNLFNMLKKIKTVVALFAIATMMSSCAMVQSPVMATIYTDVKAPVAVTGNSGSSKVGTATAKSILGILATGDASIQAAAQSAGITKIHHVDAHSSAILGIIASYTVYVYGE